jgi:hypothetical protein
MKLILVLLIAFYSRSSDAELVSDSSSAMPTNEPLKIFRCDANLRFLIKIQSSNGRLFSQSSNEGLNKG